MSRPTNKKELLEQSKLNFERLSSYVINLEEDEINNEFPAQYLNRQVKDVLSHIHHWHLLMLDWYKHGANGNKPQMPCAGFTWKTVPDLNRSIWLTYKDVCFDEILVDFQRSHKQIEAIIEMHSDTELFTKKKYKWTGTTSLASYLISSTSSHYSWGLGLIKKCLSEKSNFKT